METLFSNIEFFEKVEEKLHNTLIGPYICELNKMDGDIHLTRYFVHNETKYEIKFEIIIVPIPTDFFIICIKSNDKVLTTFSLKVLHKSDMFNYNYFENFIKKLIDDLEGLLTLLT